MESSPKSPAGRGAPGWSAGCSRGCRRAAACRGIASWLPEAASRLQRASDARKRQLDRLRREGVDVSKRRIDLRRYGWPDAPGDLDRWLWRVGDEN